MPRLILLAVSIALISAGCNDLDLEGDKTNPGEKSSKACDGGQCTAPVCTATDCDACLATSGCNWTGGACADTCLQDTDCFGPGNPAAPTCPAPQPACGDITDEQSCKDRADCERKLGACLAFCMSEDVGCCQFLGCEVASTNPPPTCSQATDCDACLATSGCNWTGGTCADTCLQDTDCFGPGNPAASTCPAPQPACGDITDEQNCKDRADCQRKQGTCLMYCQPEDVGCCQFLGCEVASSSSCAGAWLQVSTGSCHAPNDALLPDSCCDAERKQLCDKADQDYKAALTTARSCAPLATAPQCLLMVDEELKCPVCGTFVNDKTALEPLSDLWATLDCNSAMATSGCPPVVCDPPKSGLCQIAGSCSDVF